MHSFQELAAVFDKKFDTRHFPTEPQRLYDAAQYILSIGGKRIRPLLCLMGNELFDEIRTDAYDVAMAFELFHNFTLLHDDIMDKAPLRRGNQTVHEKYDEPTALLAGDVMLVQAYEYLNRVEIHLHPSIIRNFNKMAREVCEGQQLDMDLEARDIFENGYAVSMEEYMHMITLKTSVLLGAALKCGAILGGAGSGNQEHLYHFGQNLGLAFQIQDDYLDAFGDPQKFGKQPGGDILSNKKTFLLLRAAEVASDQQKKQLRNLLSSSDSGKIGKVLELYRECQLDSWASKLKTEYMEKAINHLEEVAVLSSRKKSLREVADYLLNRET